MAGSIAGPLTAISTPSACNNERSRNTVGAGVERMWGGDACVARHRDHKPMGRATQASPPYPSASPAPTDGYDIYFLTFIKEVIMLTNQGRTGTPSKRWQRARYAGSII